MKKRIALMPVVEATGIYDRDMNEGICIVNRHAERERMKMERKRKKRERIFIRALDVAILLVCLAGSVVVLDVLLRGW